MSQIYDFTDESGIERLRATISPSPGGGSASGGSEEAFLSASAVGGSGVGITCAHNQGASLLDYTDPTQPTVIADGTYVVIGTLKGPSGGHAAIAEVDLNTSGIWAGASDTFDLADVVPSEYNQAGLTFGATWTLTAGDEIKPFVDHSDTGVTLAFAGYLWVTKV